MASLNDYMSLLERLESYELKIDAKKCAVVRNRNVSCRRCALSCASGCISLDGNDLVIDTEKCIGCGTCATVCPTGAIEPRNPDDRTLAHAAGQALRKTGDVVVFACADVFEAAKGRVNPDTVVGVPCVGRIDESMIVLLASAGAHEIRLVTGDCDACPYRNGSLVAAGIAKSAQALIDVWGMDAKVKISRKFPTACRLGDDAPSYDADRRDFFVAMKDSARGAAQDALDYSIDKFYGIEHVPPSLHHVEADGTLPHYLPRRRALLLNVLDEQGEPADELVETRLWGHVIIDPDACRACRMCAVFCPTGALSKRMVDGQDVGLVHAPGLCVKCRTCEDICPGDAITLSNEVFAVDLNAGIVEEKEMAATTPEDASNSIHNAMAKLIDTPYLWG